MHKGIKYSMALLLVLVVMAIGAGFFYTKRTTPDLPGVTILAENLDTPWAIAFLPDRSLLLTQRSGTVQHMSSSGTLDATPVATIEKAMEAGEGGLLGIAVHPDFATNHFVYLYYTYSASDKNTLNRVVRMTYQNNQLMNEQVIVDRIPGSTNHNGGRLKFGPDNYLYITTGDAEQPSLAQDTTSLAGKILRVTDNGQAAPDNPFKNPIYSYGHRNPQGLAWDAGGTLWSTEHGPSGGALGTGNDEVNKITIGANYGWPVIQGTQSKDGMETPVVTSGTSDTWAPAGATVNGSTLFFGGLRSNALFSLDTTTQTTTIVAHFKGTYGRIRDVVTGPDDLLYVTTSNRDGRGIPHGGDDKLLRINPRPLSVVQK